MCSQSSPWIISTLGRSAHTHIHTHTYYPKCKIDDCFPLADCWFLVSCSHFRILVDLDLVVLIRFTVIPSRMHTKCSSSNKTSTTMCLAFNWWLENFACASESTIGGDAEKCQRRTCWSTHSSLFGDGANIEFNIQNMFAMTCPSATQSRYFLNRNNVHCFVEWTA